MRTGFALLLFGAAFGLAACDIPPPQTASASTHRTYEDRDTDSLIPGGDRSGLSANGLTDAGVTARTSGTSPGGAH